MRSAKTVWLGALALSACSACGCDNAARDPKGARAPSTEVALSAAPVEATGQTFTGQIDPDAVVALTDDGAALPEGIDEVLVVYDHAASVCLTGSEKKPGRVWLVGRISASGAIDQLVVPETDAPPKQTHCVEEVVKKVAFAPQRAPRAFSFTVYYKPGEVPSDAAGAAPAASGEAPVQMGGALSLRGGAPADSEGNIFGAGGVGLAELGSDGSGGHVEGVGVGTFGTVGRGSGTGTGFGRLSGAHGKTTSMKTESTTVAGSLPPEVIKRIVRAKLGSFKACYERGLSKKPELAGKVSVEFVIGLKGNVVSAKSGKATDLDDKEVVGCVVKGFSTLSFPNPENGIVKVTYPLKFAPDTGEPATAARPGFTVGKKKLASVSADALVALAGQANRKAVAITLATGKDEASPYAVFVRSGDKVAAVRRLQANATGFLAAPNDERIGPDGWALRVEGDKQLSHELFSTLIDP